MPPVTRDTAIPAEDRFGQLAPKRRFQPYPEYRDSGIAWLGKVPGHWSHRKLGYITTMQGGGTPSKDNLAYWNGSIPWVSPKDMKRRIIEDSADHVTDEAVRETTIRLIDAPAVLIVVRGMILAHTFPVGLTAAPVTINQDMKAISVRDGTSADFLAYLLQGIAPAFFALVEESGHGTKCLRTDLWKGSELLIPPIDEQQAIAAFLDRETARIDELIAKKQRLIELLAEKRTALISHAVSGRGSEPHVRLKHFIDLLPGFAFPSSGFSQESSDIRLLRGVNIAPGSVVWDDAVRWPSHVATEYLAYALAPGDVVLGMDRPWIGTGIRVAEITKDDAPSLLLQRVARLRARDGLLQSYLKLLLNSAHFLAYFEPILTGVSVPHISPEQIGGFPLAFPPGFVPVSRLHRPRSGAQRRA